MTLDDLITRREALLVARFRGVRTVEIEGRRIGAQHWSRSFRLTERL